MVHAPVYVKKTALLSHFIQYFIYDTKEKGHMRDNDLLGYHRWSSYDAWILCSNGTIR